MIFGRIIEQIIAECRYKNDNSAYLPFLMMPPDPYFTSFLFLDHNSGTIRNVSMVLGRIKEQASIECHMQE